MELAGWGSWYDACSSPLLVLTPAKGLRVASYEYLTEDRSILYPVLKRYLWAPMLRFIPMRRSANSITLLSNVCSVIAFVFLALVPVTRAPAAAFLLPAFAIFLYLSLDNIDGQQARRTGSSSPFGEFLDHWCDALNLGLVALGYCLAFGIEPWMTLLVIGLGAFGYLAAMWEQRTTGWLICGPIGTIEGVLLICLMYMLVAVFGYDAIVRQPILGSWTAAHVFYVIACAGFAHAGLTSILRVFRLLPSAATPPWKANLRDFVPYAAWAIVGALWFALGQVAFIPMVFLWTLTGVLASGREVIARVREAPYRGFDLVLTVGFATGLVVAIAGLGTVAENATAWTLVAYLIVRLGADFHGTTTALSGYLQPRELLASYYLHRPR
jgi:phosphatidylglycerophosphate synthase